MRTTLSTTFELIPSVRAKSSTSFSPTSFLAAMPVVLSEAQRLTTLALVEPTAAFCCIQESTAAKLNLSSSVLKRELLLRLYGHEIRCDLASMELTVADRDFYPWVRFSSVPVAIIPRSRWVFESVEMVLGYESCLEHMRITFDFRRRRLRADAPGKFDVAVQDGKEFVEPSRLREAEHLFDIESYEPAVALAASSLEERLSQSLGKGKFEPIFFWVSSPAIKQLPPEITRQIETIARLRNAAVHHTGEVKRADALRVLRVTRKVLRHLWLQQRGPVN